MGVEEELSRLAPQGETVLTIGVFDGVHLGHKHVISHVRRKAENQGLVAGVVTFREHPRLVLQRETELSYLTSLTERIRLFGELGIELIVPLSFTLDLARLSAREFVTLLKRYLRMGALVVGPGFALGRGREGDVSTLRSLGEELDFTVEVVPPLMVEGEVVSSTLIRNALARGDMLKVGRLLGRPFSLRAQVGHGVGRGRVLGFPTANLEIDQGQALPADGVYVTRAHIDRRVYKSVTNIGVRPTFGEGQRTIEVYILDFDGDLYARELRIELVERLRGEIRFASLDQLKEQIAKDVAQARVLLG